MPTTSPKTTAPAIKPTHKAIIAYRETLAAYDSKYVIHETALRSAFQNLLADTAKAVGWLLVPEETIKVGGKSIRPDGTMRDANNLRRGYWEAKDTNDDLNDEIRKKTVKGYPLTNTIFEDTIHAVLYQNGSEEFRADLQKPEQIADLLNLFYRYTEPDIEGFEQAVGEFKDHVPDLAQGLVARIKDAHKTNKPFQDAYAAFFELCKTALNPNISEAAVDEMLVQHLLTERLIRKIFDNSDFMNNNVIAVEIEKVIRAMMRGSFSREEYLKSLDRFYRAIEDAAHNLEDYHEKQTFLNTVYERFFQGYSVKVADTHGIVYTPQPIVDFMCASVVEVLQTEFGKTLGDKDVVILDPATGTGSFIANLLRRANKADLPALYKDRLFANEIMLLPYYIAALNIEHTYYELTGSYETFEGLCFVDTLDIAEGAQMKLGFMTEENSVRVERQKKAPITVIIGNPPYNIHQQDENDNNKNRKYPVIDERIRNTYSKDSKATNKNALSDAYVKFFRWASDRLQDRDGIVCMVTNNGFIDQLAFDGMRAHLFRDFSQIFHVDLHGNVRQNPKLSGTTHNVFGIQVGVGITIAIRFKEHQEKKLSYHRVPENWRKEDKYYWLNQLKSLSQVEWTPLKPDNRNNWLILEGADQYEKFLPLGSKATKSNRSATSNAIFRIYSFGVNTARDSIVYDFDQMHLQRRVIQFIENYNGEVDRYKRSGNSSNLDGFVKYDVIKWSESLKLNLLRGNYAQFEMNRIRDAVYRPFVKQWLYFDSILVERRYQYPQILPTAVTEQENLVIWVKVGPDWPVFGLMTRNIANLLPQGGSQSFPFYVYDPDGSNRRENITDWALAQFRDHYADPSISKWDIFYYVYGVLHHPDYRTKFADNLKRELPRIPFAPDFRSFADAGRKLADLHLNYESVEPYKLKWITNDKPLSYHVEKMRLNKDKSAVVVNDSLTLAGIPPEAFDYKLGNRSALDWVIDQYQVTTDKRSGITSDPNRADDERYIVDLVGRVVAVSVATVEIVKTLPAEYSAAS